MERDGGRCSSWLSAATRPRSRPTARGRRRAARLRDGAAADGADGGGDDAASAKRLGIYLGRGGAPLGGRGDGGAAGPAGGAARAHAAGRPELGAPAPPPHVLQKIREAMERMGERLAEDAAAAQQQRDGGERDDDDARGDGDDDKATGEAPPRARRHDSDEFAESLRRR